MLRPGSRIKPAWIATVLCVSLTSLPRAARADEGGGPGAPAPLGTAEPSSPAKPSYAGKDAAWWVGELAENATADAAIMVLRRMGSAVHPELAVAILDPRPQVRHRAARLLAELALPGDVGSLPAIVGPSEVQAVAKGLEDASPAVRADAARILSRWGEAARLALPRLAAQCRDVDPDARRAAVAAIRALGMRDLHVVKAALAGLDDPAQPVRELALWVLREVKPGAIDEAPLFLEVLRVTKPEWHAPVLAALGFLGPEAPGVVPALVQGAASAPTSLARGAAITALGRCAPRSPEAVRALVGLLSASDPDDRRNAALALLAVAGQLAEHRNAIILALDPSDFGLVAALSNLMAGMGEGAELAIPTLIAVAGRCPAAAPTVLADLHRMGRVAVRPSVRAMADLDPGIRALGARSCASFDQKLLAFYREEITTRAITSLGDPDGTWSDRWAVITLALRTPALLSENTVDFHAAFLDYLARTTEPEAERRACVDGLLRLAESDRRLAPLAERVANAWLRREGVGAGDRVALLGSLSALSRSGVDVVPALRTYLDDPDTSLAERAAADLAQSEQGRLVLVGALDSTSMRERLAAMGGLAYAPDLTVVRPMLVLRLRDAAIEMRVASARILLHLQTRNESLLVPDAQDLTVVLAEALESPSPSVRSWAATGLASLGRSAKAALPALIRSLTGASCLPEDFQSRVLAIEQIDHAAWAPLVPELEKSLTSDEAHVRAGSAFLLATADPKAHADLVARFTAPLLSNPDSTVRRTALLTLTLLGPSAGALAPLVAERLQGTPSDESVLAAATLGTFAPDATPAFDALAAMLADPRRDDRRAAAAPLARFGGRAVAPLLEAMKTDSMRRACIQALGSMGSEAAAALPVLEAAAQDADSTLALEARRAVDAVRGERR